MDARFVGGEEPPQGRAGDSPEGSSREESRAFHVSLDVFEGPFDLLLSLISRHRLDITEVALAQVTDEFLSYLSAAQGDGWDLAEASEFLVVASMLLDMKAARLLPRSEVEVGEDLEYLEARDLLFARLLAYKAFKEVAADLEARVLLEGRAYARKVALEPHFAALLPELILNISLPDFAGLAAAALTPKAGPEPLALSHLHDPAVSVAFEARIVERYLRREGSITFQALVADAATTGHVIARFLALLDLYRHGAVAFEQPEALGQLSVRWCGGEDTYNVIDEYDEEPAREREL